MVSTMPTTTNPIRTYNSGQPGLKLLEKCPMMLRSLGTKFIREKLGTEAKLVKRGIWVYDVSKYLKVWEEGK